MIVGFPREKRLGRVVYAGGVVIQASRVAGFEPRKSVLTDNFGFNRVGWQLPPDSCQEQAARYT